MKLDDFCTEAHSDVDRFLVYWQAMHSESPEHFPIDMSAGEWDQQFLAFCDLEYGK